MDWDRGIERNRAALARILAALVAMAGLALFPASLPVISVAPCCRCCVRQIRSATVGLARCAWCMHPAFSICGVRRTGETSGSPRAVAERSEVG